jgi:hypothetical protein
MLVSGGDHQTKAGGIPGIGIYLRESKTGLFGGSVVGCSLMMLVCIGARVVYQVVQTKAIQ